MIREAAADDAAAIAALWNWMISDTLLTFTTEQKTTEGVKALIGERRDRFFVSNSGGTVQGFATFGPFRPGPGYAKTCENSIIVDPAYAGQGIGTALMQPLFEAARAQGCHVMVAGISSENLGAVAFHDRLDFVQTGRLPEVGFKYGRYLDLILMQKKLAFVAS